MWFLLPLTGVMTERAKMRKFLSNDSEVLVDEVESTQKIFWCAGQTKKGHQRTKMTAMWSWRGTDYHKI